MYRTNLKLLVGWIALFAGALIPWIFYGPANLEDAFPALMLTIIFGIFFLLLVPVLGSLDEAKTIFSALAVSASFFLLLSQVLANEGDWPIARLYQLGQAGLIKLLGLAMGEGLALTAASPLYIIIGIILLCSFGMKNPLGFYIILALLLLYGLYPFKAYLLAGIFLWCGGLSLVLRPHFYLPAAIREVLLLDDEDERLLLELRERPLGQRQALLLLGHGQNSIKTVSQDRGLAEPLPAEIANRIRKLSDAGLIEYDATNCRIHASTSLKESHVTPGAARFTDVCSWISTFVLIGLAVIYLAIPIDFIPEILVGPVGYLDDLVLTGLSLLPLGKRLSGILRRRSRVSTSE